MSEKKYVPEGVWLTCDNGVKPSQLTVTNKDAGIYNVPVATEGDKIPGYNIKSFGACKTCPTRFCVTPAPIMWLEPQQGVYHGSFRLLKNDSTCMCMFGGPIKIHYSFAAAMAHLDWVAAQREVDRLENEVERLEDEAQLLEDEAQRLENEADIIQEHFDAALAAAQQEEEKGRLERAWGWFKDKAEDGIRMSMNMPGNPFAFDIPFTDWDNKFKDGFAEGLVNWAASMPELAYQIYQDPIGVATGVKDMAVDGFNWARDGDNWVNAANGAWDWASDGDNWLDAGQWILDNPEGVGRAVGEVAPDVALTILGGAGAYRKAAAEALEKAAKEAAEKAAREAAEEVPEVVVRRGLTPDDFGVKMLVDDPEFLDLWNQTLKELSESSRDNAYKRYLDNLENGVEMTNSELSSTFSYIRSRFKNNAEAAGHTIDGEIHHWNFPKHQYPDQIANPSNLTEPIDRATHEAIHEATSSTTNKFVDPIRPEHEMPINGHPIGGN